MSRIHLFEFLDYAWFPQTLRESMVAYLETMYAMNPDATNAFAAKLNGALQRSGEHRVVDLCSGGSGPILHLLPELRRLHKGPVQLTLTDLFPAAQGIDKVDALHDPKVRYLTTPVDATMPPSDLQGVRSIFGGFHHLKPDLARKVLEDAFRQRKSICVFEATARKPALFVFGLLMPLVVLIMTPRIRPLRLSTLFFTYIVPLLPLLIMWDGLVSIFRTYSVDELKAMTADLQSGDYQWEIGELKVKAVPVPLPYLVGTPKKA